MARIMAQATTVGSYNKFTFSDYGFSEFVRDKMLETLVKYDADKDELFDENEIKTALIEVLNENPNEIYYVVQNVFRYDKDNDRKVTYQEFVSF